MPLFCRHNRFEHTCHICSKKAKPAAATRTATPRSASRSRSGTTTTARPGVVRKQLARAGDDGYRHALLPGIKATADAERLAAALALATARLDPPGPHPVVAAEPDPERAARIAFLLALAGDEQPSLQSSVLGEGETILTGEAPRTIAAYDAWIGKAGSAVAAFTGEPGWSPQRRFARTFDRLALPGFPRAARFALLTTLGCAGTFALDADALHVGGGDDTTVLGAKRILNSGDTLLLERRAAELAAGVGVPIGALDHGFALWERGAELQDAPEDLLELVRHALALDA